MLIISILFLKMICIFLDSVIIRFSLTINVDTPNFKQRKDIIYNLCKKEMNQIYLNDELDFGIYQNLIIQLDFIASQTSTYSVGDLVSLVRDSMLNKQIENS